MRIGLIDEVGMFKYINGFGDKYMISDDGIVLSMYRMSNIHGKLMRVGKPKEIHPSKDRKGYLVVNLYNGNGKPISKKVHRLVAEAFLENPQHKRCVCHKDNNPQNNDVGNLYWGTDKENQDQAWADGLHKSEMLVIQLDKNKKIVNQYKSQNEAARKTGIAQQNISKCISGERRMAGGYEWQKLG